MKRLFNPLAVATFCFSLVALSASADNNKPIAFEQLPAKAQQFVTTHFADSKVAIATQDAGILDKSFDVALVGGIKLEFDGKGEWTEVVCPVGNVPTTLLPEQIKAYLEKQFPDVRVKEVERDNGRYEVKLQNGTEVTFNKKFQPTDIDF
jgi:outer membrane lipoprotein SlyB